MKRWLLVVAAAFSLGFAIAWTAKPAGGSTGEASPGNPVASDRTTSRPLQTGTPHSNPAMERVKNYLRKIDDSTRNDYSMEAIKDIPTADIPLLIEQWRMRAGFSGLEYAQQSRIKDLVKKWYGEEPQAALDWVTGMECIKDRQALVETIVEAEAKKNFDHALELAKQYGKSELGGLDMPYGFRDKLGDCDAARLMEILSAFPSDGNGSTGGSVDFKPDFDFASYAKMYDDARQTKGRRDYSFYPTNMIEEWTKRDPQAAWEWLAKEENRNVPFNGTGDFLTTLAKTRTKEQINQFVIDQMAARSDEESKFTLAWQALSAKPDTTQVADFISRLPGDRSANLDQLVKRSSHGSGGSYDEFKEILLGQMTAEERVRILPNALAQTYGSGDRNKIARTLRELGHTDAEISAMLPKTGQE